MKVSFTMALISTPFSRYYKCVLFRMFSMCLFTYICAYVNIWENTDLYYVQNCSALGFLKNLTTCFVFSHVSSYKSISFFVADWLFLDPCCPLWYPLVT